MFDVAFFFHILGVLLLTSGVVIAGVPYEAARRRERPDEIALLLGLTQAGAAMVGLGSVLTGVFGLWLVHLGHFDYGSFWVSAGIALFVVLMALGGLGGRRPKEARILASRLAAEGAAPNGELRALLDDRVSRAENYASLAILLLIVADMVFKP